MRVSSNNNKQKKILRMKKAIYLLVVLSVSMTLNIKAQTCGTKKYGTKEVLGEGFDYRGQSTYGKLLPGDTSRVKVVLYSKNVVRIFAAGDELMGPVNFRILKTTREYKRIPDRIEKVSTEEPVFKVDEKGQLVQKYDEWGELEFDEFGDPVYEISEYKTITKTDTIWKTERFDKEEVIFSSEKSGKKFFEEVVKTTKSIIIEVVIPENAPKTEGCVAIMIGRKFFSDTYKKFSPSN